MIQPTILITNWIWGRVKETHLRDKRRRIKTRREEGDRITVALYSHQWEESREILRNMLAVT